jgi:DNA-binding CsgD family transcriptional regulator
VASKTSCGDDGLLDLVREIYATNLDEAAFLPVLGKLCGSLGAHMGMISDMQLDGPAYSTLRTWGAPDEKRPLFIGRYGGPETNPWIRGALGYRPGRVLATEMLPGRHELADTGFWKELVHPLDAHQFLGAITLQSSTLVSHISLYRSGRLPPFAQAARARLARLVPHLRTAAEVRGRLRRVETARTAALDALHQLGFGVLLLDARGRERFTNRAAEALLAARDGLLLSRRELRCALDHESRSLSAAVAGAARTGLGRDGSEGAALLVSRPSGKRPYPLLVSPLVGVTLCAHARECAVVVLVADPDERPVGRPELLRQLHGLTKREALLAAALCSGDSLREIAQQLGMGYNTARTHLARVLSKTGARRQSDLVRLLLALPS